MSSGSQRSEARVSVGQDTGAGLSAGDQRSDTGPAASRDRWLTAPLATPPVQSAVTEAPVRRRSLRPTAPQEGVQALPGGLPFRPRRLPAALWLVGAHGGAGESTLAGLIEGAMPADHGWPQVSSDVAARVVLVARTHAAGLAAAQRALTQWAAGQVAGVELLGLVLVQDAPGRLPKELRQLAAVVEGGAPQVWHVPWVEDVRRGALEVSWPKSVREMANELLPSSATDQEGTLHV